MNDGPPFEPAPMAAQRTGPLLGVRILDVSHAAAGPYAAMMLADLGADVIKIEPPGGEFVRFSRPALDDGTGPYGGRFAERNRNKRAIALDLSAADDRAVFLELVATADGLIENMREGVMDRLGVGWEVLHQRHPALVYAAVRGFGDARTGASPFSTWPAFDVVAQAMGGLVSMTGPPGEPMRAGPLVGDLIPGLMAALGLVSAILNARETGEGQFVDVAMVDAVMSVCASAQSAWSYERRVFQPVGNSSDDVTPFGVFASADGHVAIAAPRAEDFRSLCRIIGRDDMADDERLIDMAERMQHRDDVESAVSTWTSTLSTAQIVAALGGTVPVGPVNTAADWAHDPHVAARQMLVGMDHPHHQPTAVVGCPIKMTGTPTGVYARPPLLDEHRAELLEELATRRSSSC